MGGREGGREGGEGGGWEGEGGRNTYECLTITTNALPSIRIYCDAYENNKNMLS